MNRPLLSRLIEFMREEGPIVTDGHVLAFLAGGGCVLLAVYLGAL